jgi:hypothetical protein
MHYLDVKKLLPELSTNPAVMGQILPAEARWQYTDCVGSISFMQIDRFP